jgi:phage-related protein
MNMLNIDDEVRFIIGTDIKKVQFRWPLGLPLVRNLGDKLWEVRSTIPNGIARVIFMVSKGRMILLHGFIKKTQKISLQDLKLAKERAKHYEEDEDEQEK